MARPWRGQRSERFYIEVMSLFGRHLGYVTPKVGGSISAKTGAQVTRSLSGLVLGPGDWERFDLTMVRLRPVMVIDDIPEPLGVFVVITDVEHTLTSGTYLEVQCQDLGADLQEPFDTTFNIPRGQGVGTGIAQILDGADVYDRAVIDANPAASAHLGAPIGASKWTALQNLTQLAGLTPPWFDRFGTARVTFIPYVGVTKSSGTFEAGDASPVIDGTPQRVRDRWNVPNTWVVTGRSDRGIRYAGRYTLPASHPLSVSSRHRQITTTVEVAGIASQADADQRARDQAQRDARVHQRVQLEARADPTLEPWQVRTHQGEDWLVESWSQDLTVGAAQKLTMRESVAS